MPTRFDPVQFVARYGVVLASATPFPKWAPRDVGVAAKDLSDTEARAQLGTWASPSRRR